jgi:hypothetical protein
MRDAASIKRESSRPGSRSAGGPVNSKVCGTIQRLLSPQTGRPRPPAWPVGTLLTVTVVALAALVLLRHQTPLTMRSLHVLFFGFWTWSLDRTWQITLSRAPNPVLIGVIGAVAAAVGELIQVWMPQHDVQWRGFLASMAGVAFGLLAARRR